MSEGGRRTSRQRSDAQRAKEQLDAAAESGRISDPADPPKPPAAVHRGDLGALLQRGRYIAARRLREKPVAWKKIAAELGISDKAAQRTLERYLEEGWDTTDRSDLDYMERTIDRFTALIIRAQEVAERAAEADQFGAALRGYGLAADLSIKQLQVMRAVGRLPRSMGRPTMVAELQAAVSIILPLIEQYVPDDELQGLLQKLQDMQDGPIIDVQPLPPGQSS